MNHWKVSKCTCMKKSRMARQLSYTSLKTLACPKQLEGAFMRPTKSTSAILLLDAPSTYSETSKPTPPTTFSRSLHRMSRSIRLSALAISIPPHCPSPGQLTHCRVMPPAGESRNSGDKDARPRIPKRRTKAAPLHMGQQLCLRHLNINHGWIPRRY